MAAPDPFAPGGDPKLVEVGPSIGPSNLLASAKNDDPPKEDEKAGDPLLAWVRREVSGADSHIQQFREDATTGYRFYAGHQLEEVDASILKTQGRPANAFNTVQKFIRYLCGVERRSPEALIFRAEEEYDVEAATDSEAATRGYEWATRRTDAALERSRAFEASLICGVGGVDWFLDTVSERLPFPRPQWISSFELLWPECSLVNLANTRWRGREIEMDARDIIKKWPGADTYVDSVRDDVFRGRPDPEKVIYTVPWIATENYGGSNGGARKKNKLKVLEFQWWDDEEGFEFTDPISGRREWLAKDAFRKYASRMSNLVSVGAAQPIRGEEERDKRIYRKLFLLERRFQLGTIGRCVGNKFSINTLTGMWDEDKRKWYGFMRVLMDPQRYLNKFWNQMLEINAHQAKGGLEYEEGAILPNQIADLKKEYTKPGSVTGFADGALSGNRIRQKTLPQVSPGTTDIMKFTLEAHTLVSGLSPSSQGLDQGPGVAGVTSKSRQKAGLILFAEEFDSFSKFRKEEGRIVFSFLSLIADGRALSPPSPFDPLVFRLDQRVFEREYDLYLDDTEADPSIREQYSEWIIQLAPTLFRLNQFIPEMWDYFKLPIRIREKLKQGMMRAAQERMQMQAQGLSPGGRGPARDPKEQAAKIAKLGAEADLASAKAEHARTSRPARDLKTIISALHEAQKTKIEASQHKREGRHDVVALAAGISDLFHKGADKEAERNALRAKDAKYAEFDKAKYAGDSGPQE